jgi:hypothetical protein
MVSVQTLISSSTPFSNRLAFISTLKQCKNYILWLDKYFSTKGMEYITDSIQDINVSEIKIIMAIDKVDEKFRNNFKHFKSELQSKNVTVSLKVLYDSKLKGSIHDRFIISNNIAFNIPSPDIVARNQLSEITQSNNFKDLLDIFNDLWEKTSDIINDWNDIKNKIEKIN